MKSNFPSLRHRWAITALRVALPVTTFAAGWYCAPRPAENASATHVKTASAHNFKNSTPPSADELAKIKAEFAAILKIPGSIERRLKLHEFIASLDVGTLKALLADLAIASPRNSEGWDDLTVRWAELDPKTALAWAQSLHNFSGRMTMIFDLWGQQNPSAALAAYLQMPNNQFMDAGGVLDRIIENMAKQNPQSALDALRNLPAREQTSFDSTFAYSTAFSTWAKSDPVAAAAAALNLPPSNLRSSSLNGVAAAWAQQDPSAALAWANSLPAYTAKNDAVTQVLEVMSTQDPVTAASYALQLQGNHNASSLLRDPFSPSGSDPLLGQITSTWAQQDPTALLTWADTNLKGSNFDSAAEAALKQLGQTDPAAAAAALAQIPDPSVVNQSIPDLATAWAQQDVQAALTWAQSLPTTNDDVRQTALNNVLNSWTATDPAGAAAYLQQNLSTDPDFGSLAAKLATSWGNTDPQAALTWAQSLPAGNAQNTALVAAVTQLANVDPQTAWADAEQLTGSSQTQALNNVITAIANQDPDQAAAALDNLPAGADLDTATTNVAKSWLRQDPDDAADWIGTLPNGSARDGAVTQLVSTLLNKNDPATAFAWATSIGDQTVRNSQVVDLASDWSNQNPAAAATAAQTALGNLTGLSTSQQNTLQKIAAKANAP